MPGIHKEIVFSPGHPVFLGIHPDDTQGRGNCRSKQLPSFPPRSAPRSERQEGSLRGTSKPCFHLLSISCRNPPWNEEREKPLFFKTLSLNLFKSTFHC